MRQRFIWHEQQTPLAFELADFFVHFLHGDAKVSGKTSLAKKRFGAAADHLPVQRDFVSGKLLTALPAVF